MPPSYQISFLILVLYSSLKFRNCDNLSVHIILCFCLLHIGGHLEVIFSLSGALVPLFVPVMLLADSNTEINLGNFKEKTRNYWNIRLPTNVWDNDLTVSWVLSKNSAFKRMLTGYKSNIISWLHQNMLYGIVLTLMCLWFHNASVRSHVRAQRGRLSLASRWFCSPRAYLQFGLCRASYLHIQLWLGDRTPLSFCFLWELTQVLLFRMSCHPVELRTFAKH